MNGSITSYDSFTGLGKVADSAGVHVFSKGDCSSRLQTVLNEKIIPPDAPIAVAYSVTAVNTAIYVDSR